MLRILGIDPGTARLGFALVDCKDNSFFQLIDCGVIETSKNTAEAKRLCEIKEDLEHLILKYSPSVAAIEKLFFFKNPKTIIPVAQARGVILETCAQKGLKIFEYTPLEMKKIITGQGLASKDLVSKIIHENLNLKTTIKPDDAVDAVGLALSFIRNDLRTQ